MSISGFDLARGQRVQEHGQLLNRRVLRARTSDPSELDTQLRVVHTQPPSLSHDLVPQGILVRTRIGTLGGRGVGYRPGSLKVGCGNRSGLGRDGSLQVNSQELDTLNRLGLNLTIIVMNNYSLGMVKNFQDMYFDGRNQSTRKGYSCPSFAKLAEAYGLQAIQIGDVNSLKSAFEMMARSNSPLLIEITMEGATECRPRLAFGGKLDEQHPKLP